ncbi:MAG TPA: LytR family transcriptional regulator [Candidatus Acetothermia bacterium]|nr:LytR family transcriptional regulator [Candidatus Acetothermia bacterium]
MRKQILFALGAVVVVIGIVIGWYLVTQRHVGRLVAQGKRANILVLGLDKAGNKRRSDTMMLLSVSPSKDVVLISIPRDLRVKLDDGNFHKLNAAYATGGATQARKAVANLLGVNVPFYITLDYAGFEHLVDKLGGVTITVDQAMKYDDESANPPLHIDIKPGAQTFDGKTALDYVRYRGDTGDLGRIGRQQKLLAAILQKGFQNKDYGSVRKLVRAINPYLHTNLSLVDLYDLAKIMHGVDMQHIQMATIPGTPVTIGDISFLEPQVVGMERMIAHLIRGTDILTSSDVTVAVFNGNGARMVASRTADYLRARDFKVNKVANAETFGYDKTYIIALTDTTKAQILQAALPQSTDAVIVSPGKLATHYKALLPYIPDGTDVLLIAGKGFDINE